MYEIVKKEIFTDDVKLMDVRAPQIARNAKPGQFVIIRIAEEGERVPLTIADFDREAGTITLVFQEVGKSTAQLGLLNVGDGILDCVGPLGRASHIEGFKRVICVGGGIGIAPIYPIARGFRENGAHVTSIIGARNKDLLVFEDRMRDISDELIITTDDGSYGKKGLVTEPLKEILEARDDVEEIVAIGPAIMMKFVAKTTEPFGVKTTVSLNSIMIDGTGMCGGCRVSVGEETKFCCVDGPEFDAHKVDFDLLMARQRVYLDEEKEAFEAFKEKVKGEVNA